MLQVIPFDVDTSFPVADDSVLVGVNHSPEPAEATVLESLAAAHVERLRANSLRAAPARPSAAGKLTATWGAIKARR
jgi:hypothetical protein